MEKSLEALADEVARMLNEARAANADWVVRRDLVDIGVRVARMRLWLKERSAPAGLTP